MGSATSTLTAPHPLAGSCTVKKRHTYAHIVQQLAEAYDTPNEVTLTLTMADNRELSLVVDRLDTIDGVRCVRGEVAEFPVILELGGIDRGELRAA